MKNKKLFFVLIFILFFSGIKVFSAESISCVKGVLDLRGINLEKTGNISLDGEWEFYNNQFLSPGEISKFKPLLVEVPQNVNSYIENGKKISAFFYGTYHLKILVNNPSQVYGMRIFYILSAYKLFIDGKLTLINGEIGKTYKEEVPKFKFETVFIEPKSNEIDIVLQVSNHTYRSGGITDHLVFGSRENIEKDFLLKTLPEMFILGIVIIMGFYHLGIFFYSKHLKEALYFGLFCIIMGIRIFGIGDSAKIFFLMGGSESIRIKLEYITFFLGVPLFQLFINSIFIKEKNQKVTQISAFVSVVFLVIFFIIPENITNPYIIYYQIFSVAIICHILYVIIKGVKNNVKGGVLVLVGCLIISVGTIHDMIFINGKAWFHLSFILFVFIQSMMLSQKFSNALIRYEVEKTQKESSQKIISFINIFSTGMNNIEIVNELIEWLKRIENIANVSGYVMEKREFICCEKEVDSSSKREIEFLEKNRNEILEKLELEEQYISKFDISKKMLITPIKYGKNLFGFTCTTLDETSVNKEEIKRIVLSYSIQTATVIENANLFRELNEQTKNNTMMRLSGAIVHELKTPLVSIKGLSNIILKKFGENEKLVTYIKVILKESERVNSLAEGLLEYFDDSTQRYVHEMIDIGEIYEYIEASFRQDFDLNNIEVEFSNTSFYYIYADRVHFNKMIFQIIKNAVEAVDFNKEKRLIKILFHVEGIKWFFDIEDNGVGIKSEMIHDVFKPLVTTKIQGTGLGLSIAKSISDKHNFFIAIESQEGEFTKVRISNLGEN